MKLFELQGVGFKKLSKNLCILSQSHINPHFIVINNIIAHYIIACFLAVLDDIEKQFASIVFGPALKTQHKKTVL